MLVGLLKKKAKGSASLIMVSLMMILSFVLFFLIENKVEKINLEKNYVDDNLSCAVLAGTLIDTDTYGQTGQDVIKMRLPYPQYSNRDFLDDTVDTSFKLEYIVSSQNRNYSDPQNLTAGLYDVASDKAIRKSYTSFVESLHTNFSADDNGMLTNSYEKNSRILVTTYKIFNVYRKDSKETVVEYKITPQGGIPDIERDLSTASVRIVDDRVEIGSATAKTTDNTEAAGYIDNIRFTTIYAEVQYQVSAYPFNSYDFKNNDGSVVKESDLLKNITYSRYTQYVGVDTEYNSHRNDYYGINIYYKDSDRSPIRNPHNKNWYDPTVGYTLKNPTRPGYEFLGWVTNWNAYLAGTETPVKNVTIPAGTYGDKTYYACWKGHFLTINYYANGGMIGSSTKTLLATDRLMYGEQPFYPNGLPCYSSSSGRWRLTRTGYDPTGFWHVGSATANLKLDETKIYGAYINGTWKTNLSDEKKGYVEDYAYMMGLAEQLKSRDVTVNLYAGWTEHPYKLTYNGNSGSTPNPASKTVKYNHAVGALATSSKAGHQFDGWYTAASGGTKVTSTYKMPASDTTIYAHFTPNIYYVKFNGNGATSGSMAREQFNYTVSKALTANAFVRNGYNFKGWATSSSSGVTYSDKQTVKDLTTTNNGEVNLYAVWEVKTYGFDVNTIVDGTTYGTGKSGFNFDLKLTNNTYPGTAWNKTYTNIQDFSTPVPPGTTYTLTLRAVSGYERVTSTITGTTGAAARSVNPKWFQLGYKLDVNKYIKNTKYENGQNNFKFTYKITYLGDVLYAGTAAEFCQNVPKGSTYEITPISISGYSIPSSKAKFTGTIGSSLTEIVCVWLTGNTLIYESAPDGSSGGSVTIPITGWYRLTAIGGRGGKDDTRSGGQGGRVDAKYYFTEGQVLYYTIGGNGRDNTVNSGGYNGGGKAGGVGASGGGGGATTWSVEASSNLKDLYDNHNSAALIVAAGGGGAGKGVEPYSVIDAQAVKPNFPAYYGNVSDPNGWSEPSTADGGGGGAGWPGGPLGGGEDTNGWGGTNLLRTNVYSGRKISNGTSTGNPCVSIVYEP